MLNDVVILILFACRGHVSSTVSTDFTHGMISKHLHDALNILLPNTLYLTSQVVAGDLTPTCIKEAMLETNNFNVKLYYYVNLMELNRVYRWD